MPTPRSNRSRASSGGGSASVGAPAKVRDWFEWTQLVVGIAGLFALIAYTSVAYWQANLTRQALVFGNRASIFQTGINVGIRSAANGMDGYPVVVFWQNSGNTAALHVKSQINNKSFETPLDEYFKFPDLPGGSPPVPQTVGPKGQMGTGALLIPIQQLKSIQNGTQYGYIWGASRYDDQIDRHARHLTEFCIQITNVQGDLDSKDPKNIVSLVFQPCPFHNCLDEDCKATKVKSDI
jgi:hypothetical protein